MKEFRIYYLKNGRYHLLDKIYGEHIHEALFKAQSNLMANQAGPDGKWKRSKQG